MLDAGWPPPTPRSHGHRAGHGALAYAARPFSASASASSRPPSSHRLRRSLSTSGTECRRISTQMCAWRRTCPCRRSSESGARWSCGQPFASRSAVCGCSFGARKRRAALGGWSSGSSPAPCALNGTILVTAAGQSTSTSSAASTRPSSASTCRSRRPCRVLPSPPPRAQAHRHRPRSKQLGAQRSVRAGA